MDPVKKTFTEAFADYELPVREDLWSVVQAKRQPQHQRRLPFWLSIAASLVLLVLAGALFQSRPEAAKLVLLPAVHLEGDIVPGNQHLTDHVAALQAIPQAPVSSSREPSPGISTSPTAIQPVHPGYLTRQNSFSESVVALLATRSVEAIPVAYERASSLPVALKAPQPRLFRSSTEEPVYAAQSKPVSAEQTEEDLDPTGPTRLLNMLQTARPAFTENLIAFTSGKKPTQLEITW